MAAMMYNHIDPETTAVLDPAAVPVYSSALAGVRRCTWTVYNAESGGGGNLNLHYAMDGSVNVVFAR